MYKHTRTRTKIVFESFPKYRHCLRGTEGTHDSSIVIEERSFWQLVVVRCIARMCGKTAHHCRSTLSSPSMNREPPSAGFAVSVSCGSETKFIRKHALCARGRLEDPRQVVPCRRSAGRLNPAPSTLSKPEHVDQICVCSYCLG